MDDAVPVTLILRTQVAGNHRPVAAGGIGRTGGPRCEQVFFLLFLPFTDGHRKAPFLHETSSFQHTVIIQHKPQNSCLDKEFETVTMNLHEIQREGLLQGGGSDIRCY